MHRLWSIVVVLLAIRMAIAGGALPDQRDDAIATERRWAQIHRGGGTARPNRDPAFWPHGRHLPHHHAAAGLVVRGVWVWQHLPRSCASYNSARPSYETMWSDLAKMKRETRH